MFAQVFADFNDRVREVDLYFQVLAALDNDEIEVVLGTSAQLVLPGKPPSDWGQMLKGAAYLVLYNLVEAFVRRGFQAVFESIRGEGLCGVDLIEVLRDQWIAQKNRKVQAFDGSPKVYMGIANEIVREVISRKTANMSHAHLPITGNIDADIVRQVCFQHGVDLAIPVAAKGGVALNTVKVKRNSLSHGDESFVEVGRTLVATDLIQAKDEVVLFMRSILGSLEKFSLDKSYKN